LKARFKALPNTLGSYGAEAVMLTLLGCGCGGWSLFDLFAEVLLSPYGFVFVAGSVTFLLLIKGAFFD
jgi:hypothetical protein